MPGAVGFAVHAADEDAARRYVDFTLERFGRLDILVNNAATNAAYGPLVDQHYETFRKTIDLNVWAPIMWSSLAARAWMSEHRGAIVNTASLGGLISEPNLGIYNASKAALIHLTKQSAVELAPTVRVNAVAPGVVRTKLSEVLWPSIGGCHPRRRAEPRRGVMDVGARATWRVSRGAGCSAGAAVPSG